MIVALGNALSLGLLSWGLVHGVGALRAPSVAPKRSFRGRDCSREAEFAIPLVGRDLLIGFAFAVGFQTLQQVAVLAPDVGRSAASAAADLGHAGIERWSLGPRGNSSSCSSWDSRRRSVISCCCCCCASSCANSGWPASSIAPSWPRGVGGPVRRARQRRPPSPALLVYGALVGALSAAILLVLLVRFGLLAAAGCFVMVNLPAAFPITLDASAPYFPTSLFALTVAVGSRRIGVLHRVGRPPRLRGLDSPAGKLIGVLRFPGIFRKPGTGRKCAVPDERTDIMRRQPAVPDFSQGFELTSGSAGSAETL